MSGPPDPHDDKKASEDQALRFERVDVDPGVVARWAVALGGVTVVTAAVCVWLIVFLRHREEGQDPQRPALYYAGEQRQPEGVRLQTSPFTDLRTLRAQEHEILSTYGWVDQGAGIVHIPIEQAMSLYLQRQAGAPAAAGRASGPAPGPGTMPTDSAPVPAASPSPAGGQR